MSRRRPRGTDTFAALQQLRAFLAARTQSLARALAARVGRAARPLTSWLGRVRANMRTRRRAQEDEARAQPVKLELRPMGERNPPSENIAQTALPLAATAAAATAAAYLVASWISHEQALAENVRAEPRGRQCRLRHRAPRA